MSFALSVITVTHNRAPLLEQKLEALKNQQLAADAFELVLLVNACTDDTERLLAAFQAPFSLTLLRTDLPLSVAAARNRCAAVARAPVLYFSDDDCLPGPATLMAHAQRQRKPCVAIGGIDFVSAGGVESWQPKRVHYWNVNGANTSVARNLFEQVKGFDENLSGYGGEDILLGYLLRRARFVALPAAKVRHLGANPMRSGNLEKARAAGRNAVRLARRYPALALQLGVHPLVLAAKRVALSGPLAGVGERLAPLSVAYERAYLWGALEETKDGRRASNGA